MEKEAFPPVPSGSITYAPSVVVQAFFRALQDTGTTQLPPLGMSPLLQVSVELLSVPLPLPPSWFNIIADARFVAFEPVDDSRFAIVEIP